VVIRILDHVKTASTYEDGDVVFKLVAAALQRQEQVTVSFDGILSVPSSFINGALIRLVEVASFDTIRRYLQIADSTRQINDLLRSRFSFVESQRS
jgi:hypothetical protein